MMLDTLVAVRRTAMDLLARREHGRVELTRKLRQRGAPVELIDSALGLLTANGRLIYCVCSLEPEEGEHQIKALLARYDNIRIDPVAQDELPPTVAPSPEGWVRTIPGELDGFFIARLKRR